RRPSNPAHRPGSGTSTTVAPPPRSRTPRLPAASDAPTASAASSLVKPFATSRQNNRSTSRRSDGAPGDLIAPRPLNSRIHPAGLPIATLQPRALQRPVESAQYVALIFGQKLRKAGIAQSMGSKGDRYDNAVCESFHATLEKELLRSRSLKTRQEAKTAIFHS